MQHGRHTFDRVCQYPKRQVVAFGRYSRSGQPSLLDRPQIQQRLIRIADRPFPESEHHAGRVDLGGSSLRSPEGVPELREGFGSGGNVSSGDDSRRERGRRGGGDVAREGWSRSRRFREEASDCSLGGGGGSGDCIPRWKSVKVAIRAMRADGD